MGHANRDGDVQWLNIAALSLWRRSCARLSVERQRDRIRVRPAKVGQETEVRSAISRNRSVPRGIPNAHARSALRDDAIPKIRDLLIALERPRDGPAADRR